MIADNFIVVNLPSFVTQATHDIMERHPPKYEESIARQWLKEALPS